MKVYIICPVRNVTEDQQVELDDYVSDLEADGYQVHYPPRDVDQDDETGWGICTSHAAAMESSERVDVFWDSTSKGSHFDLGMAFMLKKCVKVVKLYQEDNEGKSYVKVMKKMASNQLWSKLPQPIDIAQ